MSPGEAKAVWEAVRRVCSSAARSIVRHISTVVDAVRAGGIAAGTQVLAQHLAVPKPQLPGAPTTSPMTTRDASPAASQPAPHLGASIALPTKPPPTAAPAVLAGLAQLQARGPTSGAQPSYGEEGRAPGAVQPQVLAQTHLAPQSEMPAAKSYALKHDQSSAQVASFSRSNAAIAAVPVAGATQAPGFPGKPLTPMTEILPWRRG